MNIGMTKLAIIISIVIATAIALSASTIISMIQPAQAAASATAKTGGGAGTITSSIGQQTFRTTLSGNEEVPPKSTQATGSATFAMITDGKSMSYRIRVTNIDKVTTAHIHSGKIGQNGPVVVTLFQLKATTSPLTTGTVKNGFLSQGTITFANLEGPLKGKQISDLVKLINDGNAYVNVHTTQNPKGEIRGQISSVAAASASTSTGGSSSASAAASASAY
jgi:CHRD domain